jgi:hypothetical protein
MCHLPPLDPLSQIKICLTIYHIRLYIISYDIIMDFDTDQVLEGDIDTNTNTNAEASGSGSNTETFPPNLAALPTKRGKNPTGINGKRPSRRSLFMS